MDLTDNEKRDAVKRIQQDKPLPDKYRFLLFDDDREVELLGTGKTAELFNVVLPFAIHTTLNRMIDVQRQLNMKIMGVSV